MAVLAIVGYCFISILVIAGIWSYCQKNTYVVDWDM